MVFDANTVVFWANTAVFGANTVVFWDIGLIWVDLVEMVHTDKHTIYPMYRDPIGSNKQQIKQKEHYATK